MLAPNPTVVLLEHDGMICRKCDRMRQCCFTAVSDMSSRPRQLDTYTATATVSAPASARCCLAGLQRSLQERGLYFVMEQHGHLKQRQVEMIITK